MKLEIDVLGMQHNHTCTIEREGDKKSIIETFIADGGFSPDKAHTFVPWGVVQEVRFVG